MGEDALLAVTKPALRHRKFAALQTDARAIAIGHGDIGENEADYGRRIAI